MAGDALLDCFQLVVPEPDIYRIGQYTPVSIRDQIVRASYLVERLWRTKRLTPTSRLLVIGAGAGGVTVAIKAIHFGLRRVQIADVSDRPLSLQADCTTRWVDPAQYDWPAVHWAGEQWPIAEDGSFPYPTATRMPSPVLLEADFADEWSVKFQNALTVYETTGQAMFYPFAKAVDWNPKPGGHYQVEFDDVRTRAWFGSLDADVIVFAGGFGKEIVSAPLAGSTNGKFSTLAFWGNDTFEASDFGLPPLSHKGVLVSGGGDGALQEFIRLVTGQRSAREVWRAIESALPSETLRQFDALWHWERESKLAPAFAPDYRSRCDWLAAVHARYAAVVAAVIAEPAELTALLSALNAVTGGLAIRPIDRVTLALMGDHFDECYPLNRIVTLFLAAYISQVVPGRDALYMNVAIKSVSPARPNLAWGKPVAVLFATSTTCATTADEVRDWTGPTDTHIFDGLVIRHGIDTKTLSVKSSKLAPQPVPAHLP